MIGDFFNALAGSEFKQHTKTTKASNTATVPDGYVLLSWAVYVSSAGAVTVTITPIGPKAGEAPGAQNVITLPSDSGWYGRGYAGQMRAGTTIVFGAAAVEWIAEYAKL